MAIVPSGYFVDTSYFFAALHPSDRHHEESLARMAEIVTARRRLYTTWEIFAETVTLLRSRAGYRTTLTFIDGVWPNVHPVRLTDELRELSLEAYRRLSRDEDWERLVGDLDGHWKGRRSARTVRLRNRSRGLRAMPMQPRPGHAVAPPRAPPGAVGARTLTRRQVRQYTL